MTTSAEASRATLVRAIAEGQAHQRGALIPILHEVMDECGYVDTADLPVIADVLNLSIAEVRGVVSFYHDFATAPPPSHTITLCRAEACQSVGAQQLYDDTAARLAAGQFGHSAELREVFCLGNCALGPAGTLDGRLYGQLDHDRLTTLTAEWGAR